VPPHSLTSPLAAINSAKPPVALAMFFSFFFGGVILEEKSHFVICLRQLKVFFAIIFGKK
jgi:hypothetical protein